VNAAEFRELALEMPEASEGAHMGHPDFRVGGKVFASLGPQEDWGMVRVSLERQAELVAAHPKAYQACAGSWGRQGCTKVTLASARVPTVRKALIESWRRTAPPALVKRFDGE
jgi:hypothetical protein